MVVNNFIHSLRESGYTISFERENDDLQTIQNSGTDDSDEDR